MHLWVIFSGCYSFFVQYNFKINCCPIISVILFLPIYGKAWPIQFLVILLKIPSFPAQLVLPPSVNNLPVIEPLSDPFVDEFEFGGVDQEPEDEASIPYPAETFEDHRLVSSLLFLHSVSAPNIIHGSLPFLLQLLHVRLIHVSLSFFSFNLCLHPTFFLQLQVSVGSHPLLPQALTSLSSSPAHIFGLQVDQGHLHPKNYHKNVHKIN